MNVYIYFGPVFMVYPVHGPDLQHPVHGPDLQHSIYGPDLQHHVRA